MGKAPSLAEIAAVMPGVSTQPTTEGIHAGMWVDWSQDRYHSWLQIERDRYSQQPLFSAGRSGLVVRIDLDTGEPSEVVYTPGWAYYDQDGQRHPGLDDGFQDISVVAPDVITW
ncbi:MAG: hypothetical protein ACRCTR_09745 [Actinomycetota bacterium]